MSTQQCLVFMVLEKFCNYLVTKAGGPLGVDVLMQKNLLQM